MFSISSELYNTILIQYDILLSKLKLSSYVGTPCFYTYLENMLFKCEYDHNVELCLTKGSYDSDVLIPFKLSLNTHIEIN